MEAVKRNWADLPTDILHLILKKLPDICDFIRSRAVCKSWHASISVADMPPQFPWILKRGTGTEPLLEFYSIASNKVYTIRAPKSSNEEHVGLAAMLIRHFGSGDQYSLLRYRQSYRFPQRYLSIMNPLTSGDVRLPFLDYSESTENSWGVPYFQTMCYVLFNSDGARWYSCKTIDDRWDSIGGDLGYSCAYAKGFLFMIKRCNTRVMKVLDDGSMKEVYVIPPPEDEPDFMTGPYLVESSGEILRVCYNVSYKMADYKFYVHRLEFSNGNGQPCWVKVTSLGDQMLFFDFVTGRAFSVRASDFPGFKGNCIYFLQHVRRAYGSGQVYVINKYYITTGETVFIKCPFDREKCITWFLPTLNPYLTSRHQ